MKLITLDWEGTLVDFQWDLSGAVAETTALLQSKNIPASFANMDYAAIYNLVQEKGAQWGFGDGSLLSLIDDIYDHYDLDAASRWIISEGLEQTLAALKDYKLALISNIGRKGIDRMLHEFGLPHSFGLILTRNDVEQLKPAPWGILKAMAWAGAKKEETIHIGDSLSDLFAARNAGVKSGVVLGGQNKAETLLQEKPDLVLEKLSHLPSALQVWE
ncbi:MAG: HAD family hydrolase [Bacillota bacterium]